METYNIVHEGRFVQAVLSVDADTDDNGRWVCYRTLASVKIDGVAVTGDDLDLLREVWDLDTMFPVKVDTTPVTGDADDYIPF